jgi:aspartate/methionine/tyrosine aminotransferase
VTVRRLHDLPGFSIDRVAAAAGDDPHVLRMENLDTDLRPPAAAVEETRRAVGRDEDNSYLPFTGRMELRRAVAGRLEASTGFAYDPEQQVVVTAGGTEGLLDALLATTDPGDEVVVTDPTYAGIVNRVRLAGAVPRLVPLVASADGWRLDLGALRSAVGPGTRAMLMMSPSMPSGAVLDRAEWDAVADLCRERGLWLIYDAAMERILFDGREVVHPASLPGMRERTLVVGSVSKEQRMIGWRVGWVAGPAEVMADVGRVRLYNVVTPPGISQTAAAVALREPEPDLAACVAEWQRRRDMVMEQLGGWPVVPAGGGWSLLLDVAALGLDCVEASRLLLERGRVAATPMRGWGGPVAERYVRFVYSNEPVHRLATLRERVERALPMA